MGYPVVPATTETLCRYIAHLSEKLSSSSLPKYLNIIRLIHLECGLQNPMENNWIINSLLKGVKRHLGAKVNQKAPITVDILCKIHKLLDFSLINDCIFWAVCLTMFFGMLRKSNVLSPSTNGFVLGKHLARQDVHVTSNGIVLIVRWSKTIQYRERELQIPLPCRQGHDLCPTTAILRALALTATAPSSGPAFVSASPGGFTPLTPSAFVSKLKSCISQTGSDSKAFSAHSFRRGGATWAFNCHVPGEIIQVLGDWSSDCYKRYLQIPTQSKLVHVNKCVQALP